MQAPEVTWPQPCSLFLPFHPTARSNYFTFSSGTNHSIWIFDRLVSISTAQEEMNMRTPAVAFAALLMLFLLATRAHGIRLDRQLHEAINSKKMADPKAGDAEASVAGDSVMKHCTPDGRCSGKVKRALAHAEAAAEAEAKQQSNSTGNDHRGTTVDDEVAATQQEGRRHEAAEATTTTSVACSSSPAPPGVAARQRQTTYPDIMDIAGMDYSPAARKPPIHN